MQSRRQGTKALKDYHNPKKSNQFSPSPIKRYQTSKSFTLSSSENKENFCLVQKPSAAPLNKRFKRPLQPLTNQINIDNFNKNNEEVKEEKFFSPIKEKAKSQVIALDFKEDNENSSNKDFEKQIQTINHKKRNDKLERKVEDSMIKQGLNNVKSDRNNNDQGVHQVLQENSRKDQLSLINKRIEKESDSLMDGTYQSGTSCPTGMQYQGRWTQEEHDKFLEGLKLFGKDWRQIEEYIGSRTCAQIRSHAQKYFNRLNREISKSTQKSDKIQTIKKKKLDLLKEPSSFQQVVHKVIPIQQKPHLQVSQIHETLNRIADDEMFITLKQLIGQREQTALDYLMKRLQSDKACEKLIAITNQFHQLAMQALQLSKFEICNRMIDERNLTQFVCILISQQITLMPANVGDNEEVLQHVHTSPVFDQSQQNINNQGIIIGETHDRETARSSLQEQSKSHQEEEADKYQRQSDISPYQQHQ